MDSRVRLTYFIPSIKYGGAEVGMVRLLREIDPSKYDVTVVTLFDTSRELLPKLPDHVTPVLFSVIDHSSIRSAPTVWKVFSRTDVLVCSLIYPTIVGTILGEIHGVPTIVTWQHNTEYGGRFPLVRKTLSLQAHRTADRVLVDSNAVKTMLVETAEIAPAKISIIPLAAVDVERFSPDRNSAERSGNRPVRVVTVGRLVPAKGYSDLLACADRLGDQYEFHVVGDGPLMGSLETRAPSNVTFHGQTSTESLVDMLASADVYFQPSRHEGLCITVIEAMSVGLPIVASAVGGITESVNHGKNGYVVAPGNVDGFCRSIVTLGEDASRRAEFGRRSRDRATNRYSSEVAADKFLSAIIPPHRTGQAITETRPARGESS